MSIDKILEQRGKQNGDYGLQSEIEQQIKEVIYSTGRTDFTPYMKSTLDMVAHKLARIACGDIWHEDHWRDVEGYAKLTADRVHLAITVPPKVHQMPPAPPAPTTYDVEMEAAARAEKY